VPRSPKPCPKMTFSCSAFLKTLSNCGEHWIGQVIHGCQSRAEGDGALKDAAMEPHVFILDINGEYSKAFPPSGGVKGAAQTGSILNGAEFGIPLWFFNAEEICSC